MLTFAYYLLKVFICSGILYGYYLLALRNKIFHSWNRFYLLAVIVLSLAAPLIKINIWPTPQGATAPVIHLLQVVNTGEEFVYNYSSGSQGFHLNLSGILLFIYLIIAALLFSLLIKTLIKIKRLKYLYPASLIGGINFRNTDAKGTPFSFFNNIFWNNKIDLNTSSGKQIFQHEVAHIQEKHSYDKIFMNIVLIFFWCNPIFWLIRKELSIIHEFIADKKAVEDNDTAAFAAMILQSAYPQQHFSIANNFFYSPLKRRLQMLTKNNNPKINYLSRLLVLPLAALVFFAFTVKTKIYSTNNFYNGKKITVVIDAGHGGSDGGAFANNIYEKDITLSIAKEILDLNKNENINIVLTRSADSSIGVKQRVEFARSVHADFYISVHIDADAIKTVNSGFSVLVAKNDNLYLAQSKVLGSNLIESFKNYKLPVNNNLKQREEGVWVLNANDCPSVLVEAGYLTNPNDLKYLTNHDNQKTIARNILSGIEKYAQQNLLSKSNTKIPGLEDTIPGSSPKEFVRLEGNATITDKVSKSTLTGDTIIIHTVVNSANSNMHGESKQIIFKNSDTTNEPLYILDGKGISKNDMNQISPNKIESINVFKGESAIKKYGDKGKDGVIEIITKKDLKNDEGLKHIDTVPRFDKIFTQTENEAEFPGGQQEWQKYIQKKFQKYAELLLQNYREGTCIIQFIVDQDGNTSDVKALTMEGSKLAEIAIDAIKNGPQWQPGMQNGHTVTSYKKQPIIFKLDDRPVTRNEP